MDTDTRAQELSEELVNKVALMLPHGFARVAFNKVRGRVRVAFAERIREELDAAVAKARKGRHTPANGATHYGFKRDGDRALHVSCDRFWADRAIGKAHPVTDNKSDVDCPDCIVALHGQ